ncbi:MULTISPECIES: hypothetical protein [unclassified Nocardia]|uniref:hypothetical protein n=1 Tax=unclassified Nocardia TaxID=2637762 RepID=UPI001CE4A8F7|nr:MULTISPECIES: hypothetical protein [unclassified Nocardia]
MLDLSGDGFRVLFEAEWVHRAVGERVPAATEQVWGPVRGASELAEWAAAWDPVHASVFRAELLDDDAVTVLGGRVGNELVCGAVVHCDADVVGISNVFGLGVPADELWAGSLRAVARRWPNHAIVGYEQGDDLAAAIQNGCAPIGPLRVWGAVEPERGE